MLTHFRLRMAAVAMIMVGGFSSMFCSASSFYSCTDGTLDPENFSSNNCAAFFSSNCHKIDTQEKCDDKDACQWDAGECKRVKDTIVSCTDQLGPGPIVEYPVGRYIELKQITAYDENDTGNQNKIINLAEVEVYDDTDALVSSNKVVTGSSVHSAGPLANLVDGNKRNFAHTHGQTETETDWIKIDLGAEKKIKKIVVTNRKDCCKERIAGLKIDILNSSSTSVKLTPAISISSGSTAANKYTITFPENTWSSSTPSSMDFVMIGDPLKCTAATNPRASEDAANTSVYRYTAEKTIRYYPNATIASSWDANWESFHTDIDCTGFTKGADMAEKTTATT